MIITHTVWQVNYRQQQLSKYKRINGYFVNNLDQSITWGGIKELELLFDNPKLEQTFSPKC